MIKKEEKTKMKTKNKSVKEAVKQYQTENEDILLAIEAMKTSQLSRDIRTRYKQRMYRVNFPLDIISFVSKREVSLSFFI